MKGGEKTEKEKDKNEENLLENEMNQKGQLFGGRGLFGLRIALQRRLVVLIIAGVMLGAVSSTYLHFDLNGGMIIGALAGAILAIISYLRG